ncbi:Arm DNA-binding domain-containing protein [Paraburkholderia dipogonis]
MQALKPTGAYQEYADTELRGFRVKVTPAGLRTYTYRWTRPDGSMGRLTVGRWPEMKPGEARETARRESELQDRKGDTLTATAVRRVKRQSVAKVARSVPTLRAYLEDTYTAHLRTYCKTPAHGDAKRPHYRSIVPRISRHAARRNNGAQPRNMANRQVRRQKTPALEGDN